MPRTAAAVAGDAKKKEKRYRSIEWLQNNNNGGGDKSKEGESFLAAAAAAAVASIVFQATKQLSGTDKPTNRLTKKS